MGGICGPKIGSNWRLNLTKNELGPPPGLLCKYPPADHSLLTKPARDRLEPPSSLHPKLEAEDKGQKLTHFPEAPDEVGSPEGRSQDLM